VLIKLSGNIAVLRAGQGYKRSVTLTEDNQTEKQSPLSHFGDKLKQWKPGESGNPGGKPKGKSITAELRKLLDKGTTSEELAQILLDMAKTKTGRNQLDALKEVLNRSDGKVPDTHKIESDVPISIVYKQVGGRDGQSVTKGEDEGEGSQA